MGTCCTLATEGDDAISSRLPQPGQQIVTSWASNRYLIFSGQPTTDRAAKHGARRAQKGRVKRGRREKEESANVVGPPACRARAKSERPAAQPHWTRPRGWSTAHGIAEDGAEVGRNSDRPPARGERYESACTLSIQGALAAQNWKAWGDADGRDGPRQGRREHKRGEQHTKKAFLTRSGRACGSLNARRGATRLGARERSQQQQSQSRCHHALSAECEVPVLWRRNPLRRWRATRQDRTPLSSSAHHGHGGCAQGTSKPSLHHLEIMLHEGACEA